MREFIYYSKNARTTGQFDLKNLMQAGRMDIVCQITIMAFFISHAMRDNVKLHLILDGPPDPTKHLEMFPGENSSSEDISKIINISKKDIAGLIKKMLYKYKKGEKHEIAPGYSVEKKPLIKVAEELKEQGKEIYLMDRKGKDIRELKKEEVEKAVFIIGDQDGIPKKELKKLKNIGAKKISVGAQMYFASQTLTLIQNELDRYGI